MDFQLYIVYIILAIVAVVLIRYVYRQVTGKTTGCNCGSCSQSGCHCSQSECQCSHSKGTCHCHDTQK